MAKPSTVQQTVKVLPNPFCALDQNGTPQGVVGVPGTRRYVGARIDELLTEETGKVRFFFPDFPTREYELPLDGLVANAIRDGSLLVTNVEDFRKVGGADKKFLAPEQVLADEEAKALKRYIAVVGEGATLEPVPTRREADIREEAKAAQENAEGGGQPATSGDPTKAGETPPRNALQRRGERVVSGPAADPHVVIAPRAEKE